MSFRPRCWCWVDAILKQNTFLAAGYVIDHNLRYCIYKGAKHALDIMVETSYFW